jgi:hypothetical protein
MQEICRFIDQQLADALECRGPRVFCLDERFSLRIDGRKGARVWQGSERRAPYSGGLHLLLRDDRRGFLGRVQGAIE